MKAMVLGRCCGCQIRYPEDYLNPVHTADGITLPVCGICALQMLNQFSDVHRSRFDGEMAKLMRRRALHWRRVRKLKPHV
jgi:hypothetical protein